MTKRTFKRIRDEILRLLAEKKELTPTQISQITGADFRTVKRHLIWLVGLGKLGLKRKGLKTYYFLKENK